eukprot:4677253-Amphidinium_carterae.2
MTGAKNVLAWAVELDQAPRQIAAGAAADLSFQTTKSAVQELAEQLYTALMSLTVEGLVCVPTRIHV